MANTALIFGASGLVGNALLKLLLESPEYDKVKAFVRKTLPIQHQKLEQIVIDFDNLDNYSSQIIGDHIYLCLGTTMAKAGSKDAFYKIDYTYTMDAAKLAAKNGVKKLCLISSLGANPNASVFYSKVTGELENDISNLGIETVHIVRPSLLLGDRDEKRVGERIGIKLSEWLSFIFVGPLKKYKAIHVGTVAKSMFQFMQTQQTGLYIHESIDLQKFK
jgi:uncharacterized protein YbjT (DUF2867 family)